jgi:hypothetical protein
MQRRERMTQHTYQGYVRNYICPDPAWHAKKHADPHHQFQFFDKGSDARSSTNSPSVRSLNSAMI